MPIQIEFDDIVFNTGTPDGTGTRWWITDYEGWESPELRQSILDLTGVDGVAIGESNFAGRPMTFQGAAMATSEANFWIAYNRLINTTAWLRPTGVLKFYEGSDVKRLYVARNARPQIKHVGSHMTFQVHMIAPDPIKLADTATTATYNGSITATNAGAFRTFPVVTMTSTGTPTFTNTDAGLSGLTLGFTGSLPSGTVIDFLDKTVRSPGDVNEESKLDVAADEWWYLNPGANDLTRGGSGNASISYRSAWV